LDNSTSGSWISTPMPPGAEQQRGGAHDPAVARAKVDQ